MSTAYNGGDTDSDGIPGFQDLDSDDDGIWDIVELKVSVQENVLNNLRIDLSGIPIGIYSLQYIQEGQMRQSKFFVIQE